VLDTADVLYDDTLWRPWLLQVLARLGIEVVNRSFHQEWQRDYLDDVHRGHREFYEALLAFLLSLGLSPAQAEEVEAACRARRTQTDTKARPLPGVKSTLGRLHAGGMTLAVLSDSEYSAPVLAERLGRFGLGGLFKAVVSSIDLERTKPDPACYRAVLEAVGLPAQQVALVGRNAPELDGAAEIGMSTIAFSGDPKAKADARVGRFEEIYDVLSPRLPHTPATGRDA
jgi:HAD superfamily hydrolase (TIGR01509 family)